MKWRFGSFLFLKRRGTLCTLLHCSFILSDVPCLRSPNHSCYNLSPMEHEETLTLFKRYLQSKGKSATKSREKIVSAVLSVDGHFSAAELWRRLQGVSLATIYRTLELLEEAGFVRRISLGSDLSYFEPLLGRRPHWHLVCTGCQQLIEFSDAMIEERLTEAVDHYGFQPRSVQVQVFGLCQKCQNGGR